MALAHLAGRSALRRSLRLGKNQAWPRCSPRHLSLFYGCHGKRPHLSPLNPPILAQLSPTDTRAQVCNKAAAGWVPLGRICFQAEPSWAWSTGRLLPCWLTAGGCLGSQGLSLVLASEPLTLRPQLPASLPGSASRGHACILLPSPSSVTRRGVPCLWGPCDSCRITSSSQVHNLHHLQSPPAVSLTHPQVLGVGARTCGGSCPTHQPQV